MAQITLYSSGVASNGSLLLQSNGTTTAVTIDTAQNMGLGVTPSAWSIGKNIDFGTTGAIDSDGYTRLVDNAYYNAAWKTKVTGQSSYYQMGVGVHSWFTAPSVTAGSTATFTQAMTLDASGNFMVGGTSTTALDGVFGAVIGGSSKSSAGVAFETSAQQYMIYTATAGSNGLIFYDSTNNAERARITSGGDLLVGTTSAGGTGTTIYKLASGNSGAPGSIHINGSSTAAETVMSFQFNGTAVGSITRSNTATAYNTSSDYRLKNSIAPMTGALAKLALLKPCTYKWNIDGSDGQGFIAHELQEVLEGCVTGEKDAVDANGNPSYQGIDTSFLVATLTAAIQELKAIVDAQAVEIAALKGTA
jgi:hypothetical protein